LNQLAELHYKKGNYTEALALQKRSLDINEKALGPNHIKGTILFSLQENFIYSFRSLSLAVAQGLQNLANLYYRQGDYDQAETLYKKAITMKEHGLGREHPGMPLTL